VSLNKRPPRSPRASNTAPFCSRVPEHGRASINSKPLKKRAARKGRNPATGEAIKIKASKRVAFAASRDLKTSL
jgi:hypothetical protein